MQPSSNISPEVAEFLLGLVNAQTITVGASDFDEAVQSILDARRELTALIGDAPTDAAASRE